MLNIVLYEPEIPPNTGNIARLCVATNCKLYLIEPLGFSLDDKQVKRAGLDYWQYVDLEVVPGLDSLWTQFPEATFYYLSTKASKTIYQANFSPGDFVVFGPESRGLPEDLVFKSGTALTIPMFSEKVRSLNLATSVGIVLYEALRQTVG